MTVDGTHKNTVRTRHYRRVVAFAIVAIVVVALYVALNLFGVLKPMIYEVPVDESNSTTTSFYRQVPTRLEIPKLAVDTTFVEPLGLNSDQTIMVPDSYTEVGWYKNGVTPGEVGAAVILGHVDSKDGPGVFFSLGQLNIGDEIKVTRADNTAATFKVTELTRYAQSDFPSNRVYTSDGGAVLRLVTCTGTFDRGEARYTHNLVVYAELQ